MRLQGAGPPVTACPLRSAGDGRGSDIPAKGETILERLSLSVCLRSSSPRFEGLDSSQALRVLLHCWTFFCFPSQIFTTRFGIFQLIMLKLVRNGEERNGWIFQQCDYCFIHETILNILDDSVGGVVDLIISNL